MGKLSMHTLTLNVAQALEHKEAEAMSESSWSRTGKLPNTHHDVRKRWGQDLGSRKPALFVSHMTVEDPFTMVDFLIYKTKNLPNL